MIPALAFNDAVTPSMGLLAASEALAKGFRKLNGFATAQTQEEFQFKFSYMQINDLHICSVTSTGFCLETENNPTYDLILPLNGHSHSLIKGVEHAYASNTSGLFAFCESQRSTHVGSLAKLHFNPERLAKTILSIAGQASFQELVTKMNHSVSLDIAGISFSSLFTSLFEKIDMVDGNSHILSKLALDDAFYRLAAFLLYPEMLISDDIQHGKRPYERPELRRVCDFISAHLTQAISLTKMEQISGLSARVLQHAFQSAYGLTPKEWVRTQRLHAARKVMLTSKEPVAITALAYDFCFASPSHFAHHYQQEFGELPSQTLKVRNGGGRRCCDANYAASQTPSVRGSQSDPDHFDDQI